MTTDLEEMLTGGMARYAETVSLPDGLVRAARRCRRRRLTVRACASVGSALAVAVTALIVVGGGPKPGSQMLTDAYVVSEAQSALTAAGTNDGQVMHATSVDTLWAKGIAAWAAVNYTGPLGSLPRDATWASGFGKGFLSPLVTTTVWWSYRNEEVIEPYSAQGTLQADQGYILSPSTVTSIAVNNVTRTWSRYQWSVGDSGLPFAGPSIHGQLFLGPSCEKGGYSVLSELSWPEYLRSALACGDFRYTGRTTLDGRQALVLDNAPSRRATREAETLWVDPRTYLPIRELQQLIPGTIAGMIEPGTFDPVQTDFQWLPPTPANIRRATVSIPAGYRETH
jgi:hypothetical protein